MTPSRQFMIQQAVLNAVANRYPHTFSVGGLRAAAMAFQASMECDAVAELKRQWVCDEYRALASRYSEAA